MSILLLRGALQKQLDTITPVWQTAKENVTFTPPGPNTPYLAVFLMYANPENQEMGPGQYLLGYMHVNVCTQMGAGTGAGEARAEAIKAAFKKGRTFTNGALNVFIPGVPASKNGVPGDTHFSLPVHVPFKAWVEA